MATPDSPHLSANELGNYLVTPDLNGQEEILRRAKYSTGYAPSWYEPVRVAALKCLQEPDRGSYHLATALARFESTMERTEAAASDLNVHPEIRRRIEWEHNAAASCRDALLRFAAVYRDDIGSYRIMPHDGRRPVWPGGLRVAQPYLCRLEHGTARGALGLRFNETQPDPQRREAARYTAAIIYYARAKESGFVANDIMPELCVVIDVFGKRAVEAPRIGLEDRIRQIEAGGSDAAARWPHVRQHVNP